MNSIIIRSAAVFLFPLFLVFSIISLLRGHNEPGGGFVGGLVAASAFLLHMLARGLPETKRLLFLNPLTLTGIGLAFALFSSIPGMLFGSSLFDAVWFGDKLPGGIKPGTPLVFDIGVYCTVLGVVLVMVFALAELKAETDSTSKEIGSAS